MTDYTQENSKSSSRFNPLRALNELMEHLPRLTPTETKLMIVMIKLADENGECWPSITRLCELCGTTSRAAICGALDGLHKHDLLETVVQGNSRRGSSRRRLKIGTHAKGGNTSSDPTGIAKSTTGTDSIPVVGIAKSTTGINSVPLSPQPPSTQKLTTTQTPGGQRTSSCGGHEERERDGALSDERELATQYLIALGLSRGAVAAFADQRGKSKRTPLQRLHALIALYNRHAQEGTVRNPRHWLKAAVSAEKSYSKWKKYLAFAKKSLDPFDFKMLASHGAALVAQWADEQGPDEPAPTRAERQREEEQLSPENRQWLRQHGYAAVSPDEPPVQPIDAFAEYDDIMAARHNRARLNGHTTNGVKKR